MNKDLLLNITILYVENDTILRGSIEKYLAKYAKKVYTASNGLEGLNLFNELSPDILIANTDLPKLNGLEMIKKINNPILPVIITSSDLNHDTLLKAIELKVDKFISLPIELDVLNTSINDCVISINLKNKLFEKENLLQIIDENVLISITDARGVITDVSDAFCTFTKYSRDELIGKTHRLLKHEDTPDDFYSMMWKDIKDGKIFKSEIKNKKKNGDVYFVLLTITPVYKDGAIINYTAIRENITNRKKLEKLSIEDSLTSLYNRRYFNKVCDKEIRRVKREKSVISLLSIDIDYFKKYNDIYGHPKGDDILIEVATLLKKSTLRASDYVFRLGGEEFSILFSGSNIEESFNYSNRIIKRIEGLKLDHKNSKCSDYLTISAGLIVQSYNHLESIETLYKYSDDALYEAKQNGRNQVVISKMSK